MTISGVEAPVRISHRRMRAIVFMSMMFVAWLGAIACGSSDPDRVTVAFFNEWPAPNQVAQIEKTYDEALGVEVTWRAFGNGVEINEAMAAGEVDIAYAQGIVPWVVGVSSGQPFSLVGIAFSYSEADNCVVHADVGIDRSNAKDLEGRKVATIIGNVTHYKLLRTLEHLDVDSNRVEIVEMNGADAAEALKRGEVAMACAFGGPLQRMKELGRELLTAQQQEAAGIRVFDVIVVSSEFADEHPEAVRKFMEVTEQANDAYRSDPDRYDEDAARVAGMDLEAAQALLSTSNSPPRRNRSRTLGWEGALTNSPKRWPNSSSPKAKWSEHWTATPSLSTIASCSRHGLYCLGDVVDGVHSLGDPLILAPKPA